MRSFAAQISDDHAITLSGGAIVRPFGRVIGGAPVSVSWFDPRPVTARTRVVSPSSSAEVQISDAIYRRDTGSETITDYTWSWSYSHPTLTTSAAVTRTSSNPAVIVPDPANPHLWTAVAPGTATLTLSNSARTVSTSVTVTADGGATTDTFLRYATAPTSPATSTPPTIDGPDVVVYPEPPPSAPPPSATPSLRGHLTAAVDTRLAGKTPETAIRIYASQHHAESIYVRNSNCWAADLDLTPISPWNSAGTNTRAGTLVSPRHVIMAAHYEIPVGATIRFVTAHNEVVTRTIAGIQRATGYVPYYPDFTVGVLDADVPSTISFARVLPDDWRDYIPSSPAPYAGLPTLSLDQEEKALVTDVMSITDDAGTRGGAMVQMNGPGTNVRAAYFENKIGGDSGNPAFWIINGQLVLLTVWTFGGPGAGTHLCAFKAQINVAMTALGGSYQLSAVDLSSFQKYP